MPRIPKTKTPLVIEVDPVVAPVSAPKRGRMSPAVKMLLALLLLAVGVAGYFYYQYRHSLQPTDAEEIAKLTTEIGKVMMLPDGEAPTLATVTDKTKLSSQSFFQKAENGDKVLIYANSGRAILYRPSIKKIVNVTAVNVSTDQSVAKPAETQPASQATSQPVPAAEPEKKSVTAVLYNGSKTVGVTNTFEDDLKAAFPDVSVVKKDKAAKDDYAKNIVVDVSGAHASVAADIAAKFGATVGILPDGEARPDADILIIVSGK